MSSTDKQPNGGPCAPNTCNNDVEQKEQLPPLSSYDFKVYNRLASEMEYYHDRFRRSWETLWEACINGRRPRGMSLKQFIAEGLHFAEHLTIHHNIEETRVFPYLAKKMPEFRSGRGNRHGGAKVLRQHREIHAGLEGFETYLRKCAAGEEDLELEVLRGKMATWREVLWTHLDEEVKTLGAENMRRYWTKEEMARIPM